MSQPPHNDPKHGISKSQPPAGQPSGSASPAPGKREDSEPTAGSAPTPMWLIILFGLLFYWGQLYLDNHSGEFNRQVYEPYVSYADVRDRHPKDEAQKLVARGEQLYQAVCASCHAANGLGTAGLAPPLAGSEWVTAAGVNRLIHIPLHGLTGPITVAGQNYAFPSPMVGFKDILPNEDIAAILSFIRQAWGNTASPVTPEQVQVVRERTQDRPGPYTVQEILQVPENE